MDNEAKKIKLEMLLEEEGLNFEFIHPPNISEPILLIKDYAPTTDKPLVSFAFTLIHHYQQNGDSMGRKCWMTWCHVKKIEEKYPKYHPPYKQFEHSGLIYFPFSANLAEYTYGRIKELCRNLYGHLDFSK